MKFLLDEPGRRRLALADTFKLEFRVKENDNDTGMGGEDSQCRFRRYGHSGESNGQYHAD